MTEHDVKMMLLPVQILSPATETNGGLVKFPGGREIILGKTDADALRVAAHVAGRAEPDPMLEAMGEIANRAGNFMDKDASDWMPSIYKIACEAIGSDPWPMLEADGWKRNDLTVSAPSLPTQPAREEVREALTDVTAHLAAAISLLERTPKAKNGAASDKMFDIMLSDYRKSLEKGRSALAQSTKAQEGGK